MSEHEKHVTVSVPSIVRRREVFAPRVVTTMPVEWMARGFAGAVRRFRDADELGRVAHANDIPRTAQVASIALFEASTWMDSLAERFSGLVSDPHVRAFQFARMRTHHQWADAIFFDPAQFAYVWRPESNLPPPEDPAFQRPKLERLYADLLAGRPIRDVLGRLEKRVTELVPEADLEFG
jgi:hypothetical protein